MRVDTGLHGLSFFLFVLLIFVVYLAIRRSENMHDSNVVEPDYIGISMAISGVVDPSIEVNP